MDSEAAESDGTNEAEERNLLCSICSEMIRGSFTKNLMERSMDSLRHQTQRDQLSFGASYYSEWLQKVIRETERRTVQHKKMLSS